MTDSQILLLDLDDVLLFSRGYRAALRGAVAYFGRRLGYLDVPLPDDEIDIFEAFGLTAEWDSATVCICLMLARVWEQFPGYSVGLAEDWARPPAHRLRTPSFRTFITALDPSKSGRYASLESAEDALVRESPSLSSDQKAFLHGLLQNTRQFDRSPIHRVVQEFNLGSRQYAAIYAEHPKLAVEGTLMTHDRPRLDDAQRRRLMRWTSEPGHHAAVFTNRPSTPPDGGFDSPEAELGMQATGLSQLKVVGGGGLAWVSSQRNLRSGDLLKPSPVHALAALRSALGDPLEEALEASAALALDGRSDPGWTRLNGAQLHVFEDSAKGLRSAVAAVDILRAHGISLGIALYGISDSEPKRAALSKTGASLFDNVPAALARVKGLEGFDR